MSETKVETIKITDQFRSRNGFVYDFRCEGARLTLSIAPRELPTDAGEWKVEARTGHAQEATVVTEWGATRVDALREVGRAWVSRAVEQGLPKFDWEGVEKALREVRAI
jgi:hypothetical protein